METFCFNHYILSDDSEMVKQSKAKQEKLLFPGLD